MNLMSMELEALPLLINILLWADVGTVSNINCWCWESSKTIISPRL